MKVTRLKMRIWPLLGLAVPLLSLELGCAATGRSGLDDTGSAVRPRAVHGAAATAHPLATQAALDALEDGGNAVDAAVAAALMLGVVNGYNSGLGGGCFILIRTSGGELAAIDGREAAPAAALRDMFAHAAAERAKDSSAPSSVLGPLASGVPGELAALESAAWRYGRRPLARALRDAARMAELGFIIDEGYARAIADSAGDLAHFEASKALLLHPDGSPLQAGKLLKQPDLAATLRAIADHGIDWFYRGPFAESCADWMAQHGGILTAEDFAAYQPINRGPLVTTYRGYTIVGFPPPSSGGVHVAQILNLLDGFHLDKMDAGMRAHVMVETMKLAFADRAHWLGDPAFAKVPRGLIEKGYADSLAVKIRLEEASEVASHGTPLRLDDVFPGGHTTHLVTADDEGNWVSLTATINTAFGSKVVIPGTGVVMNNEMDDFVAAPGKPNYFGLVGSEANAIEPGKRPLSSMSPTIVLKDGQPVMACGAAGGPKIITQVILTLVNHLDLKMTLADSIAAPRFHHQWSPDRVAIEPDLPQAVRKALTERGHRLEIKEDSGVTTGITILESDGFTAVSDPRISGAASTSEGR